ncbi:MAG: hypothetical protein SGI84_06920, partial [Gemmatimonadota bacterium]|nr:hypothetical protein [Gemmatimonadota bacterium]
RWWGAVPGVSGFGCQVSAMPMPEAAVVSRLATFRIEIQQLNAWFGAAGTRHPAPDTRSRGQPSDQRYA